MSGLAPHFAPGTPYESWQLHACGEPTGLAPLRSLLAMPVSELDGGERQPYAERMEGCARCWAETNTEDTLLAPPFGSPYPPGASEPNCMEFSDGAAVPEWLWRRFDGEFVMVDHWGDDERPYMESQGINWFVIWALANVANFGVGSHVMNTMSEGGGKLHFDLWFPYLPPVLSDPWGIFKVKTAYNVDIYFDGQYEAHAMTELPMLGFAHVSGVWTPTGPRYATILPTGGYMVFFFQWLEGQDAYLANLTMRHPTLGIGQSLAKWARVGTNATDARYADASAQAQSMPPAAAAAAAVALLVLGAALAAAAWRRYGRPANRCKKPARVSQL
uniref:Uncharacterized protein n=1 Tax=Emiliania huxleyi TaxID=2903 RepID=A0A7S3SB73_EMIHU